MIDQSTTQFYQNKDGEIFVVVQGWENGRYFERLIQNVEKMGYSSDTLYELSLSGFDNFNVFTKADYNGYSFQEMIEQLGIESGDSVLIASLSADCGSRLIFSSMDEYAKSLFSPIESKIRTLS